MRNKDNKKHIKVCRIKDTIMKNFHLYSHGTQIERIQWNRTNQYLKYTSYESLKPNEVYKLIDLEG